MSSTTRIIDRGDVMKVEWTIPDFLSQGGSRWCLSDSFFFVGHRWRFDTRARKGNKDVFPLVVMRTDYGAECSLLLGVAIKKKDGRTEDLADNSNLIFLRGESNKTFYYPSFSRDALERRTSDLLPSGRLTFVFAVMKGYISTNTRATRLKKLSDDLSELIQSGEEGDFTVSVQGERFYLHRNILGARSPVFRCMLNHEMAEKRTGAVSIDDCELVPFRAFVRYLYSGRIDYLHADTVLGLYKLADKYQVDELKSACLDYAQRTLSVETFCDIFSFALTHDFEDLLNPAVEFFSRMKTDIVETAKWVNFLKDHPVQANELLKKAFQKTEERVGNKRKRKDGNHGGIVMKINYRECR